jgi:hypothetical protein
MRWNKPQCELFYITNFATIRLLTLWDLLEAQWHIVYLNFWYIYHMRQQQLSPCTTTSFNGSWRTGSMSSTTLFPRVFREIATESSEWAYIPTSPQIIRVGIYTHFSSKSISRATMLPLIALVFQKDNVSRLK